MGSIAAKLKSKFQASENPQPDTSIFNQSNANLLLRNQKAKKSDISLNESQLDDSTFNRNQEQDTTINIQTNKQNCIFHDKKQSKNNFLY